MRAESCHDARVELVPVVLAALSLLPRPPGGTETSRRVAVEAMVTAATEKPLFARDPGGDGSAEIAATALLLAAVAQHESSFNPRVGDCTIRGGGAISYFQLLGEFSLGGHTRAEICASPLLAAQLALRVLHLQRSRCKGCAPSDWLAGYASGAPRRPSRTSRETLKVLEQLAKNAHLSVPTRVPGSPRWEHP